jgi:hypothetical protein
MYRKTPSLLTRALPAFIVIGLIVSARMCAFAQPGVPETKIHGELVAGAYPISDVYKYAADLNVWFDFGAWNPAKFYFNGGILTLIKANSNKGFQPDRYRGTLELGARLPEGKKSYSLFLKHQSFHDIDRFDGITESYEILGLKYSLANPWNLTVSAGNYVHKEDVDYQWDFGASVDNGCVAVCSGKPLYGAASAHYVTESGITGRDHFLDYSAEIGVETHAGVRYFMSYRQVHDINQFNGETDHGLLVGVRYKW